MPLLAIAIAIAMVVGRDGDLRGLGKIHRTPRGDRTVPAGSGSRMGHRRADRRRALHGCVLLLMLFGMYRIEGLNPVSYMIPAVAMAVKSGVFEELVFRGVLFRSVEDMAGQLDRDHRLVAGLWLAPSAQSRTPRLREPSTSASRPACCWRLPIWSRAACGSPSAFTWCGTMCSRPSSPASFPAASQMPGLFRRQIEGPSFFTGGTFGMEQSMFALILCTATGVVHAGDRHAPRPHRATTVESRDMSGGDTKAL